MLSSTASFSKTILGSKERRNALANIIGKGVNLFFSFIFLPIYLSILGHEAYGIVAFQTTLQVLFSILELGLPATVTREIALHTSPTERETGYPRDVVRTSEGIAAGISLFVITVIILSSSFIASKWLIVNNLPQEMTKQALYIMSCQIGVQFLSLVYVGALVGAGQQVVQNTILSTGSLIRGLGSVGILWVFPDIRFFLLVQLISTVMIVLALRVMAYRSLPNSRAKMSKAVLRKMFPFALQIILNSLVLTLAAQLDRLIISKTMPIEYLGYYSLAFFFPSGIGVVGTSILTAIYPGLVHRAYENHGIKTENHYLSRSSRLAVILMPFVGFLLFFGSDIMLCWTRDAELVAATRIALPCLALSAYITAINQMPISLASAKGFMYPAIIGQLILTLFLSFPTYMLIKHFGLNGAALANLASSGLYLLCVTPVIHRYNGMRLHLRWIKKITCSLDLPSLLVLTCVWTIGFALGFALWLRVSIGISGFFFGLYIMLKKSYQFAGLSEV